MRLAKLQAWQTEKGVDDLELAAQLGCSRQTVQRLHKGESMPRRSTLAKLQILTEVTPAECMAHLVSIERPGAPPPKLAAEAMA